MRILAASQFRQIGAGVGIFRRIAPFAFLGGQFL